MDGQAVGCRRRPVPRGSALPRRQVSCRAHATGPSLNESCEPGAIKTQ
jgi:hypothetical protein